jgi:membrane protein YqaA with SNARE-associated domain
VTDETGRSKAEAEVNPYRPPAAEVGCAPSGGNEAPVGEPTETMLRHLRDTGPWALFLAVMGFIGCGFMLLSGISSVVMLPFMQNVPGESGQAFVSGIFGLTSAFYVVSGASYGVASYYLARYSQAIGRVNLSRSLVDVEGALEVQHRFWRASGVIVVVTIAFTVLFAVGFVVFSVSMASALSGIH